LSFTKGDWAKPMRLRKRIVVPSTTSSISASGAYVVPDQLGTFAWLPSTWPSPPSVPDEAFIELLAAIFQTGMLDEIGNVIEDAFVRNGNLEHRGHVIAISMMCALDSLSRFASVEEGQRARVTSFVRNFFPFEFSSFADNINTGSRNGLVHEWFMTEVAFLPDDEPITVEANVTVSMGLLTFKNGLERSVVSFVGSLRTSDDFRQFALDRYTKLQSTART
jgi:hypothetical protein